MVFFNDLLGNNFLQSLPMQETKYLKHCEAEIVFGVQSQNCSGNGICQMFLKGTLKQEKQYCHFGKAKISADFDENLIIKIEKSTLRPATLKKHFSNNEFEMEENFKLPALIQEALTINRSSIQKGSYAYFLFDHQYWIFAPAENS